MTPTAPKCRKGYPSPCLGRKLWGHAFSKGEAVWRGDHGWLWMHNGTIEEVTRCPWCLGELPDHNLTIPKALAEPEDAD